MLLSDMPHVKLPLPKRWPKEVRAGFLHSVSLASQAFDLACADAWHSSDPLRQALAENARLKQQLLMERREKTYLHKRLSQVPGHQRPVPTPEQRYEALAIKAERRWSQRQCARALLFDKNTVCRWETDARERPGSALLDPGEPVNTFPEYVTRLLHELRQACPHMGVRKLAESLARTGLHLAKTTVHRLLKRKPAPPPEKDPDNRSGFGTPEEHPAGDAAQETPAEATRAIKSRHPNHTWVCDLTVTPTAAGFWVPWLPFAALQVWPFAWWEVAIVDHFSRRIMAAAAFCKQPTSQEVADVIETTCMHHDTKPKYIVSDKGKQFWSEEEDTAYQLLCEHLRIKPRFGALYKHGSIAITERAIKTVKDLLKCIILPFSYAAMQAELNLIRQWHNQERPHDALSGRTPDEVYFDLSPKSEEPRREPRSRWPVEAPCAAPQAPIRGSPGVGLHLQVTYLEGRRHLPIVRIKERAA